MKKFAIIVLAVGMNCGSSLAQSADDWAIYDRNARELLGIEAGAVEPRSGGLSVSAVKSAMARTAEEKKESDGQKSFAGLSLGVALSLTIDDSSERVKEAKIVGDVVRVTKEENVTPRVMLEAHKFLWVSSNENSRLSFTHSGTGPFIGIVPGEDPVIEAFAIGWMWGWKTDASGKSFNLALGAINDRKVQLLGDGFSENAAPPKGETEVRYKETDKWAAVLIASFSF